VKEKFCAYCRNWHPPVGFKTIVHVGSGSRRAMCPTCQNIRKKPREELEKLAKQQKIERKKK
jgi:hypothetical protein